MDLDSCQIIVENIGPSKGRAGDEAPEFVILMRTHQLHINPLPQVFHGLPEDRVVHELVEVPLKVAGGILSELCIHPDIWLHLRALVKPDFGQTHVQRRVQLQIPIVKHIAVLVAEVVNQLFNLGWRHPNAK